jgi:polyisoprenoid-binding protein YceI
MSKYFLIALAALLVVGLAVFAFGFSRPDGDLARANLTGNVVNNLEGVDKQVIDMKTSTFTFEGYGPGKAHTGYFTGWDAELYTINGDIVGLEGLIQAASVVANVSRVTEHLKSDDFFDVAVYPEISFKATGYNDKTSELSGTLLFRGVSQEITFPVVINENSISADFVLDTTPFKMKYQKITNQVRIQFMLQRGSESSGASVK